MVLGRYRAVYYYYNSKHGIPKYTKISKLKLIFNTDKALVTIRHFIRKEMKKKAHEYLALKLLLRTSILNK